MGGLKVLPRWLKPALGGAVVIVVMLGLLMFANLADLNRFGQGKFSGKQWSKWQGQANMMEGSAPGEMPSGWEGMRERMMGTDSSVTPAPGVPMMGQGMMRGAPLSVTAIPTDRKVTQNASLNLRVESIDDAVEKVRTFATVKNGYVENSSVSQPKLGVRTAWMTVKVPAQDFPATFDELKRNFSYVVSEDLGSADLTSSFIDLQARLNNKQAEERIAQDLFNRATKISDAIEVSQHLAQVRTEIESLQGQLRLMENQTAMAAITISMSEDPKVVADSGEFRSGNVWKRAWNELTRSLAVLGSGLVVLLVAGVPIIIIYVLILWGVYVLVKKSVKRVIGR